MKADIPDGLYPGDYLVAVGQQLAEMHGGEYMAAPESEWLPVFRSFAIGCMMEMIRDDLTALGIEFDDVLLRAFAGLRRGGQGGRHHPGSAGLRRGL